VVRALLLDRPVRCDGSHADVAMMRNVGHVPFQDHPRGVNERVRVFCEQLDVQTV
jgi:hypothetical protein